MGAIGYFVGNILPYITIAVFLIGVVYRVAVWWSRPSPASIPVFNAQTSVGQSIVRVLSDVLFFRSLLRFRENYILWLGGWVFHISLLLILLRHLRYFMGGVTVPAWVNALQGVGVVAGIVIGVPLLYLLVRRVVYPELKFISTPPDYIVLLLLLGVVVSGLFAKYVAPPYIIDVKFMLRNLMAFRTVLPEGVNSVFLLHFFLVQVLAMYLPFSKVMHMGGVFFSPTRTNTFGGESHTKKLPEE